MDGSDALLPSPICVPPRRITKSDIAIYAELTNDHNPIHTDGGFAAGTTFGHPIAFGTLVIAPIWQALEAALDARALEGGRAQVKFVRPVSVGSAPTIEGHLVEVTPSALSYEFVVRNEDGQCAAEVVVVLQRGGTWAVPRRGGA
ncbi:MAG: MaoC domain protein dehydratase [Gammaproteobacteria bacterium]|nr:MaoC domain protein dehydratase [Gammaproteobacteria bacterium]